MQNPSRPIFGKCLLRITAICVTFLLFGAQQVEAQKGREGAFRDSTDGAIDLSDFILSISGFLPVPIIITEPAVGYGGGMMGAYFHKKKNQSQTISQPDISIAGGGGTENGTWFAGGGHMGNWNEGKIRYRGFLMYAQPKLTFYLFEDLGFQIPVQTQMDTWFFYQSLSHKLGKTKWFLGGEYIFVSNKVRLNNTGDYPILDPILKKVELDIKSSGVGLELSYDGRDNIYSTVKGVQWKSQLRYFPEFLGSTQEYGAYTSDIIIYQPVVKERLFLGFRNKTDIAFDNPPFYTVPSVGMRGVKRIRYQGEFVNTTELEARMRVYKRWSILGFGGVGQTSKTLSDFKLNDGIWAGGTGFRYMLARLFNLQAGVDFAWSEKDPIDNTNQFAFYITVGSAWGN